MSILGTYRELLRNGPLTRLFVGEFVSSIGDWLYLVALVVLVYQETQDPVVLGIVGAVRMLPYILLSIPAGIITDRAHFLSEGKIIASGTLDEVRHGDHPALQEFFEGTEAYGAA